MLHSRKKLTVAMTLAMSYQTVLAQFSSPLNLSDINGDNGFVIVGESTGDRAGQSVSSAGDVNGDGIDDLIIGADETDNSGFKAGSSYVIFGSDTGLSNPFNLSTIDGLNGFKINGESAGDYLGRSVSSAGDINGDGITDLIISAIGADPNGASQAGSTYVVFGSNKGFPNPFNLSSIDGLNGIKINGESANDLSGSSVSSAGDINGDGVDDVIIGAIGAEPNGATLAGSSYVVFGGVTGLPSTLNLSTIDGLNGFKINGQLGGDRSGCSVSSAGDINGDGIDDLIIGAWGSDPNGAFYAGRSYVVFGSNSGFPNPLNLSTLGGDTGFKVNGESAEDYSGASVSAAGDINGDGFDDLIIGASGADPNGEAEAGSSYVVFGSDTAFPNPFNLSLIDGLNGFKINGEATGDWSGWSVSSAGDVNGDGIADLIIGAHRADSNGASETGSSYVVFGSETGFQNPFNLLTLNGVNGFKINGEQASDRFGGSVSSAGDVNGDGIDDLIIGAKLAVIKGSTRPGKSYVVFGDDTIFKDGFE
ncbi:MAG: integrin alpha [Marinicella sp.]